MKIQQVGLKGLYILEPKVFEDNRGYFFESFRQDALEKAGINKSFIQDNQSKSGYGVVRGLHMQTGDYAQVKLIRVILGKIWDVAVDVRPDSPTFGNWFGVELSDENGLQFLIPHGFCHGFSVLSESTTVLYKCDQYYNKQSELGIRYNDPDLDIDWKIPAKEIVVSEKDSKLPFLKELFIK